MQDYRVIFENGNEITIFARDIYDVEDQLIDMGFSSRDVADSIIDEVEFA